MGKIYGQLSLDERGVIGALRSEGRSLADIGRMIGRDRSTICRELKRNSKPTKTWPGGYDAKRADALAARRRRWDARFKMARQPDLRKAVRTCLAMGWSPEQVAGRLAREQGRKVISHESIYRFIYHKVAQKDPWHHLLPRAKHRRGKLERRGGSSASLIRNRIGIVSRPAKVDGRREKGHWEADLMLCSAGTQAVLVTHERKSRVIMVARQPNKQAQPVADRLLLQFGGLPPELRRSITFDNGNEFAEHWVLNHDLDLPTYFCDPHSPWQKGGVENAIGRLRRFLPRKTNLDALKPQQIDNIVRTYNATPRKCLQYRTPAEVFLGFLKPLHFNRESVPRLRGV